MLPERLDDRKQPFTNIVPHTSERHLLHLKVSSSDSEIKGRQGEYLKILGLNFESSAEDVRRAAISTRIKFEEGGVNRDTVRALRWALNKTNDCNNERQFLWFLLDGWSFEQVDSGRNW